MAWLAVDKDGEEWMFTSKPHREGEPHNVFLMSQNAFYAHLPKGSIFRLIWRKLTWEDEPVELTEETLAKPVEVTDKEIRDESGSFDMSGLDHTSQMLFTCAFQDGAKWMRERMSK